MRALLVLLLGLIALAPAHAAAESTINLIAYPAPASDAPNAAYLGAFAPIDDWQPATLIVRVPGAVRVTGLAVAADAESQAACTILPFRTETQIHCDYMTRRGRPLELWVSVTAPAPHCTAPRLTATLAIANQVVTAAAPPRLDTPAGCLYLPHL